LQWLTQVRDSDKVTLREKVTRRRTCLILRRSREYPAPPMVRRACLTLLAVASALSAAGCASTTSGDSRPDQGARLMLDSAPDAIHSGIYISMERSYDEAEGVNLQIEQPGGGATPVKALETGQADMALVDIHDLAVADAHGKNLVGVMALVQTPLAGVLTTDPAVRRPRDLEDRRVGVTTDPVDAAILDSIVEGDGGDPAKVHTTTVRAKAAVRTLTSGMRVTSAVGPWNTTGVALQEKDRSARQFLVDDFGAPSYPEVVLAVTRETLDTNKPVVQATIRALRRGYEIAMADPDSAVSALMDQAPTLNRTLEDDEMQAVSPSFEAGADYFGQLQPAELAKWATWEQRFGIVKRKPDVAAMFDTTVAKSGLKEDPDS
jgi:ABC-type nitrate/sulfonate/bicarbonate transport system substrate-binding protein